MDVIHVSITGPVHGHRNPASLGIEEGDHVDLAVLVQVQQVGVNVDSFFFNHSIRFQDSVKG